MTSSTDLGLSIRLSMFDLRETGDWDIFLGPPERARAETGGADQWAPGVKAEGTLRVCQGESSNFRIPGIPTISFQFKLYSERD